MADVLTQYADKVVRVTLHGQMLNGSEEWQTGFYVGQAQGPAGTPSQAWTQGVCDAFATFFTVGSGISNAFTFLEAKAALLNVVGKYDNPDGAVVAQPATVKYGPETGPPLPPQCALVATLVAGSGKGLAGKGRMYIPGVKWGIDSTGHLDSGAVGSLGTKLTDFINAVNALPDRPGVVINASRGHKLSLGLGARNVPVNGVRVGNVYDTQRRRRNALAESYWVSPAIVPPA
jgi:hypothetical protein